MLGPNGQSNGCVSFSDYPDFLDAYLKGEVDRLVVVEHLATAPGPKTASLGGTPTRAQTAQRKTFVLVHGAWHGGWCWRRVSDLLEQQGHKVFTPTLTGVGERSHLMSKDINLVGASASTATGTWDNRRRPDCMAGHVTRKGSRPRAAHDQRTQSTYLFGAVCPDRGAGAALVLPACNCEAMQLHLDEIATKVALGAHAIILLDQAGWHGAKALVVPNNISLVPLPPRAPELNGQENIWQFMRQNWLSNRIFKSFDDIVNHCCYAWNTLIDQPWKIMSIARRDWAAVGHSI
jgi:hypothetical protein